MYDRVYNKRERAGGGGGGWRFFPIELQFESVGMKILTPFSEVIWNRYSF